MNLIIIRKNKNSTTSSGNDLLRFAISSEPIASVVLDGLSKSLCWSRNSNTVMAVPKVWSIETNTATSKMIPYTENVPICSELLRKAKRDPWLVISNGRFATQVDSEFFYKVLAAIQADIVAVNIEPELLAHREKVRLTPEGRLAGFRRLYTDSAEPAPFPADWPHYIFVKNSAIDRLAPDGALPRSFSAFLKSCRSKALALHAINMGGTVLDLETEHGLLNFCQARLCGIRKSTPASSKQGQNSN